MIAPTLCLTLLNRQVAESNAVPTQRKSPLLEAGGREMFYGHFCQPGRLCENIRIRERVAVASYCTTALCADPTARFAMY
jgi:hypothetical protein